MTGTFGADERGTRTRLEAAKLHMKRFVFLKNLLNKRHEFGICTITSTTMWHLPLTSKKEEVFSAIDDITFENQVFKFWDASTIFQAIEEYLPASPSDFVLRVVLIYARSNVLPQMDRSCPEYLKFIEAGGVFDCVYLHDDQAPGNKVQTIYDFFTDLEIEGQSRVFDVSRLNKRFAAAMAQLLGHPRQRCPQKEAQYTLTSPSPTSSPRRRSLGDLFKLSD
ncbi:hypothetical protein BDK51DRAFT_32687 [Blyttiomyces helicus]|uniref:Uncharacterized protein n=1 Tax=Blyttiomyces helicus TaxID=388810 RepID=A0A4P9W7S5_9FUNG|nr:hypothetical protein BDK51DRAFT_32687 [Blyttiomyces helicus]|eukprot:RKO88541.1 hypothetical protein BDK51DRAFT_32687 [Blyttiomyces helicus]